MKLKSKSATRVPSYGGGFDRSLRNIDQRAFRNWYDRTSLEGCIGNAR